MLLRQSLCLVSLLIVGFSSLKARGETFAFGGGSQNNINGAVSAVLTNGAFGMSLQPVPAGSLLAELSSAGMGIDSRPLVGDGNDQPALFDVLGGSGPLAGTSEGLQFSFAQPGVLTGINFDGVKDESLEYFILDAPGATRFNFFDSAANTTIPGVIDDAVAAGAITGQVIYLLEINSAIDDESQNLYIPFAAGQTFTLTFDSLGPEFHPLLVSNGARLQGITVQTVPESTNILTGLGLASCGCFYRLAGRKRGRDKGRSAARD